MGRCAVGVAVADVKHLHTLVRQEGGVAVGNVAPKRETFRVGQCRELNSYFVMDGRDAELVYWHTQVLSITWAQPMAEIVRPLTDALALIAPRVRQEFERAPSRARDEVRKRRRHLHTEKM